MRIVSGGRLASAIAFLAVFGAGCGSVAQRAAPC
jgi:hypothetical protein